MNCRGMNGEMGRSVGCRIFEYDFSKEGISYQRSTYGVCGVFMTGIFVLFLWGEGVRAHGIILIIFICTPPHDARISENAHQKRKISCDISRADFIRGLRCKKT